MTIHEGSNLSSDDNNSNNDDKNSSTQGSGKPLSPKKLAANRRNAQHSSGPRSAEDGKARSARNSYKHGFFSRRLFHGDQLVGAEGHDTAELGEQIWEHYAPVGYMQELLVEKIVCESVRFGRLLSYEQQEFSRRGAFFGLAVDRVLRYQTAVNKQLFQAVRQLEDLQAKHKAQSPGPEQEDCALGNGEVAPHDLGAGGVTESEPNSESQLETSVQDSASPVPVEEDSALPLLSSLVDSGTYHHEPDLTKNCGTNPPHHPKEEEVQSDSLGNACPEG